jgi:hypothetical protein
MGGEYQELELEASDEIAVKAQYYAIVEECLYDHGHSGYSGTFAEKADVDVINELHTEATARAILEENDKWGNSQAIRIGDTKWLVGGWCSA